MIKKSLRLFLIAFVFALPISGYILYQSNKLPDKDDITFYLTGKKKSYIENLQEQAMSGDTNAMIRLGNNHRHGYNGLQPNNVEAVKWYKLAAKQGDASAQYFLGRKYETGRGVTQNYKEAEKWLRLSAEQGNAEAQVTLGLMHLGESGETEDCLGETENHKEAVKWFRLSAEQKNADAQCWLGHMYLEGMGVTEDYAEAIKWWKIAAEQGHERAKYNLENYA